MDPATEIPPSAMLRGPFCSLCFAVSKLLPFRGSFSRQLFKVPAEGAGRYWVPHAPSTGSTCCGEFTACLVLAGCLPLPVFLDPGQLPYLQGTLPTHLNNSVSSLNMQNMQHNPVSCFFFLKNSELLSSGCWSLGQQGRGCLCLCPKPAMFQG